VYAQRLRAASPGQVYGPPGMSTVASPITPSMSEHMSAADAIE
jgi:hypothetical protein